MKISNFVFCIAMTALLPTAVFAEDHTEQVLVLPAGCSIPDRLVIFHTNDHHGSIYGKKTDTGKPEGGLARQATWIKATTEQVKKQSKCPAFLLFSAGDVMAGDLVSDLNDNRADFQAMRAMGFNGMTPGNHEFDLGVDKILRLARSEIKFPVLSANIFVPKTKSYPFTRYGLYKAGTLTIAVVGLTTEGTGLNKEDTGRLEFQDPEKVLKDLLPTIKKLHKPDAVILLAHIGGASEDRKTITTTKTLGEQFAPEIDLIIDGHDHKLLEKPVKVNKDSSSIYIVEAGYNSCHVGMIDFDVKPGQRLNETAARYQVKMIDGDIPEDKAVRAIAIKFKKDPKVKKYFEVVFKENSVFLDGRREQVRKQPTNLSRLVNDAYVFCGKSADFSLLRPSSIRNSIPVGTVTMGDFANVSPFLNENNHMALATMTGAEVIELLKTHSTDFYFSKDVREHQIKGKPINATQTYQIAGIFYDFETVLKNKYPFKKLKKGSKNWPAYDCIADYAKTFREQMYR